MGNCASCSVSPDTHPEDYGDPANSLHILEADNGKSTPKVGSVHSQQGAKDTNQDSALLYQGNKMEDGALCAVFDGHGMNGHIVSRVVRNKLPTVIQNHMKSMEYGQACISAFEAIDNELQLLENVDFSSSGTTAVVVVQQGEELVIANLGDSRAVLGTLDEDGVIKAIQLTVDQKPGVSDEAERIQNSGGRIFAHDREPYIQRVWLPDVDFPGLAMTRAFGNFGMKSHGIIATPVVTHHSITSKDQFLVLASDGVWDVLSNDEVVSIVSSANSEKKAAEDVVNEALVAWNRKFPNARVDDTTVVCLFLQEREENLLPVTTT